MKKIRLNGLNAVALSRQEMKQILGGQEVGEPLPNTFLCDCGPNTDMSVHGANMFEAMINYLDVVNGHCTSNPKCVPAVSAS